MIVVLKFFIAFPFILYELFKVFYPVKMREEVLFGFGYFVSSMLVIKALFDNLMSFFSAGLLVVIIGFLALIYISKSKKKFKLHRYVRIFFLMYRRVYVYLFVLILVAGIIVKYKEMF